MLDQLRTKGLVLEEGDLVDATIVEKARGGKDKDGESTRDRCASYTRKHGRTYSDFRGHGFKAHINASTDRFVADYVFDSAKVHDSQHIDALIEDELAGGEGEASGGTSGGAAYADSASMDKQRSADLAERGIHDGIVQRRPPEGRGQEELTDEQKRHNRACSKVRTLVEHPTSGGAWMGQMGYGKARYRGLRRNAEDFGLTAVAYNLKRSLSLLGMALTPLKPAT